MTSYRGRCSIRAKGKSEEKKGEGFHCSEILSMVRLAKAGPVIEATLELLQQLHAHTLQVAEHLDTTSVSVSQSSGQATARRRPGGGQAAARRRLLTGWRAGMQVPASYTTCLDQIRTRRLVCLYLAAFQE
jgi:hypothetical protein